jgi:general secretion pathway protein C
MTYHSCHQEYFPNLRPPFESHVKEPQVLTMPGLSISRSDLMQRAVVSLATFAALAVLGLVLAYWSWLWSLAPVPEPRSRLVPEWDRNLVAARDLFGTIQPEQNVVAPAAGIEIKLLGVVAASAGRGGYAVMLLDAGQIVAVLEGEDIASGVRLVEVQPNQVVLDRNGLNETLALPVADLSKTSPISVESDSRIETLAH